MQFFSLYPCNSANRVKRLSHRENYGFHGFYFLFLFVYKYFVDASFIFVSCTKLQGESVKLILHPLQLKKLIIILAGFSVPRDAEMSRFSIYSSCNFLFSFAGIFWHSSPHLRLKGHLCTKGECWTTHACPSHAR